MERSYIWVCLYMQKIPLKEYNTAPIIVGDFHTPVSIIDRISRRKISKEIEDFNNVKQLDLIDIYRPL